MDKKFSFSSSLELTRRHFLTATLVGTAAAACNHEKNRNHPDAEPDAGPDVEDVADADVLDIPDADADAEVPLPRPVTTVRETIRGRLEEVPQFEDLRSLFGLTKKGPGEPWIVRDEWGVAAAASGPKNPSSLAYFAQLTDVHILDEESPARAIHSPIAAASAWRPYDAYSTHMLDAAMRTLNEFAAVHPHDFVVFTGDVTDNHLYIELRWFLDVVEGNGVNPDTGADDDPLPTGPVDPHDSFLAAGLDPRVPWYICVGNHDAWTLGSLGTSSVLASPTGSSATAMLSHSMDPTCFSAVPCPGGYCYSDTPERCHVPMEDDYYTNSSVAPDAQRRYIDLQEFKSMVMGSTRQGPPGHGFTQANLQTGLNYYSVDEPVPGLPVSLIVLDTTTACTVTNKATGAIDSAQMAWISERLDHYASQRRAIVVVSHHQADNIPSQSSQLVALLNACPYVVLHVVGHGHMNRVYPHPPAAGQGPENGYWEVQTPSPLEWPQQMRFFEIVDEGDGTGSIYVTVVNHAIAPGTPAEAGRFYSLVDVQEGRVPDGAEGAPEDRNVILRFAWPAEMKPVLAQLARRPVESLHFLP